jgi:hypothetical protein
VVEVPNFKAEAVRSQIDCSQASSILHAFLITNVVKASIALRLVWRFQ